MGIVIVTNDGSVGIFSKPFIDRQKSINDFDDNIFDEDDALDYIIYEKQKELGKKPENQNAG